MSYYPSLASDSLLDVIRLIRTPNVGPITFFQLVMRFGSASEALAQLPATSVRGGRKNAIIPHSKSMAEQEIEKTLSFGARFIRYGEAEYPELMLHMPDAPPVITVLGHHTVWRDKRLLAMVGSRNSSANGCQLAQKFARDAGQASTIIVSGLARGIDSYAHKGSLATGTVAVIAGGIDHIYPPENEMLYRQIAESGAVISDQPFGQIPFASSFPSRNRLIAGMSHGTLVVEASPKSGSLITARLALEYNRELFAVPGSPLDARSKGCNQLIKDGAHIADDAADVVRILQSAKREFSDLPLLNYQAAEGAEGENDTVREWLLNSLSSSATELDTLMEQSGYSAGAILAAVLELELAGRVKRSSDNKVALIYNEQQDVA